MGLTHKGGVNIIYTKEDFISDYLYSCGKKSTKQEEEKRVVLGQEIMFEIRTNEYEDNILLLNTVLRVDDYLRTPYSIHMSYPTARSLYTIRLYIMKQGHYITADFWGERHTINPSVEFMQKAGACEGDILIETLSFEDEHYPYIYKTLQNLEVGHLLYNIGFMAEEYGLKYNVNNTFSNTLLLCKEKKNSNNQTDRGNIEKFWERAKMRSSGKYYGGLINFEMNHEDYRYFPYKMDKMQSIFFGSSIENLVKKILFINNGEEYINDEYHLSCSYESLMKEYHYVNFRTQSQFFLIMVKWPQDEVKNYADIIQYIGMLAQEICIENARESIFNRPVKQINQFFWSEVMKQNNLLYNYIPFYGVITGKESNKFSGKRNVL